MQVIKTSGLLTTRPAPPRAVDIPLASSARYSEVELLEQLQIRTWLKTRSLKELRGNIFANMHASHIAWGHFSEPFGYCHQSQ